MKKLSVLLFIVIILFFSSGLVLANEDNTETKIKLLDQKILVLEIVNKKILESIYFALGGTGAILLTIVGLNFFQNFQLNKRKIDTIKDDLENSVNSKIEKNTQEIVKKQNDFEEKIKELIDTFQSNSGDEFDSFKTSIEEGRDNLREMFERRIENVTSNVESTLASKISDLNDKIFELNREKLEEIILLNKEKDRNYISQLTKLLEMDIEKGWEFRIHSTIKLISECLETNKTDSSELTKLQIALDKLPEIYDLQRKHIQEKMVFK